MKPEDNFKYAVFPGEVKSISDGDIHYISADKLIRLYGVNPRECLVVSMPEIIVQGFYNGYNLNQLIHLRPRPTGNYNLEGK